ncbi:ABC transporter substrate-binding protein [Microbacterium sp. ASV81]|uniref:ABC transporter substrate-binding protein n=1 Tax=Microbacterium capsulatum TaxID=3041921 RepID=A0ABU0XHQ0_9MICO|nr:ABC transporter substrate-binding protein [Microbacterium sp. ASV81]MDQ4214644.1 ABC transporter substrate-binding protein [Microbacterium sp. ASV81]
MVLPSLPDNLTIFPYGGNASQAVLSGLGSQLGSYEVSCKNPVPGKVTGKLAESIALSKDLKSIEVKLRPLKSQTGHTLSTDDVMWSFSKYGFVIQPVLKASFAQAGYDVDNLITKIDDHTFKFNLKSFSSTALDVLQNPLGYIYDSVEAQSHATSDDPVAQKWLFTHLADYSGWKLDNFSPRESLAVTADPNWGGPKRAVKKVAVQSVPDDTTRQQLLETGEAQVAVGFQPSQYRALVGKPGINVTDCASLNMDNLMFSTRDAPLNDVRVRTAVSMAINRDELAKGAYAGYATPAVSSFNKAFNFGQTGDAYKFDPAKAKKLLADAGYPNGFDLTLTYSPTRPGPVTSKSSVLVQSMLAAVGIRVKLEVISGPTQFTDVMYTTHLYQSALYGEPIAIADPAWLTYVKFGKSPNNSGTFWSSPALLDLLSQVSATPASDTKTRSDLFHQIAKIGDTELPLIELVETPYVIATNGIATGNPLPNGQLAFSDFGK